MIELAETGGEFAAAGTRSGYHHQTAGCLNILIPAEALLRDDQRNVGGVIRYDIVLENPYAEQFQPLHEFIGRALPAVVRDHNTADVKTDSAKSIDETQCILVVCDAEVTASLGALDVISGQDYDNLRVVFHLQKHFHLAVRLKAGQHS